MTVPHTKGAQGRESVVEVEGVLLVGTESSYLQIGNLELAEVFSEVLEKNSTINLGSIIGRV